jgi:hypothetical protein
LDLFFVADCNELDVFPNVRVLCLFLTGDVAFLVLDGVEKLKADAELSFEFQDVKRFVFFVEI